MAYRRRRRCHCRAQQRTPVGSFNGALKKLTAPELGAAAIKAAVAHAGIDASSVEDAYIGNVLQAAVGQAPARQAVIKAGLGEATEATTINKVGRASVGSTAAHHAHDESDNLIVPSIACRSAPRG